MMLKSFFTAGLSLLLLFTSCCAMFTNLCEEEEKIIMPEETSIGANTFGCYVNGELFVHKKEWFYIGPGTIGANYYVENNILIINSTDFYKRYIGIVDSIVQVGKTHRAVFAEYMDENKNVFTTNDDLFAEIHLTKLDTVNLIVSGRFSFKAKHTKSDSIINVTNGRFDVQLFDYWTKNKDE